MHKTLRKTGDPFQGKWNLEGNLKSTVINGKSEADVVVGQREVLKGVSGSDGNEVEELREEVKFGYSKDVMSINRLLDKGLEQLISMNNGVDKTTNGKKYESQRETID